MIEIICIISLIFNLIFGIIICYFCYIKEDNMFDASKLEDIHKISQQALDYLNKHRIDVVYSDDVETFITLEDNISLINTLTKHYDYDTESKKSK